MFKGIEDRLHEEKTHAIVGEKGARQEGSEGNHPQTSVRIILHHPLQILNDVFRLF